MIVVVVVVVVAVAVVVAVVVAAVVVAQQRNVNSDSSSGNHFMDHVVSNVAEVAVAGPNIIKTISKTNLGVKRSKFRF